MPPDLSVIIVSWNTAALLRRCLESLFAEAARGALRLECWVVDNASHDGTAAQVRAAFPQVRLIANRDNVGFARANNQALAQATGRAVLLLNPDTELRPGALAALLAFLEAQPGVGAVGPRLLNPDGTLQPSCSPLPTLLREGWRLFHLDRLRAVGSYAMQRWPTDQPREVEVIQGACLLLRRAALAQVGVLDERYFIYSEEVDLCARVGRAGWRLVWLPHAQVIHLGGQSTQQVAPAMFLRLYQSKVLFFRKHHGRRVARLYKGLLAVAALPRLLLGPLAWLARGSHRAQQRALAGRYRSLLRALPGW